MSDRQNAISSQPWSNSTINIYPSGNWLKMIWIYAASNAAKMIEIEPLRNFTDKHFIRNAMGRDRLATGPDLRVATMIDVSGP